MSIVSIISSGEPSSLGGKFKKTFDRLEHSETSNLNEPFETVLTMKILPKLLFAALLFLGAVQGLYIEPEGTQYNTEPTGHNETAFGGCTRVSDSFVIILISLVLTLLPQVVYDTRNPPARYGLLSRMPERRWFVSEVTAVSWRVYCQRRWLFDHAGQVCFIFIL